ncbi:TPA: hypothetical protein DIU27_01235 [Candidatus Collierbacteria bacterium]|uniref:Uncharacterized protein n=1 Tax=Candidatus Collierbacteria bacterium GW2011_GWB2_44_22 TaxID=1618387 RepID=A0A0G1HVQ1_9BACT|nr:MAG: hypothetical protein UW31_C0012G0033 [Candidatus Collierbacteria bacterium GW2011_GWA2_44_13]KKT51151.1 MAG: hypothetical protein UW44_C0015G0022 [Candidatus Collierbacteria bacterium GW2011_GWB2_44_22]KKT64112.1 MAG: hypothetical protein UW58_C0050G0007 [Candidatus Collierbacteria bacterium GW2011_GWC2_44_30]KKT68223.1 MAG: hypothetical protein UW64_C0026G0012 [Microgenomates group bacterium GW2011_GWC1_44_37]KKT88169.1 MAG: hypothetical protein UW88_C0014G0034 [Candidatus Collierbacte
MIIGFLILLGSVVLLVLDIKLIMEKDNVDGFVKLLGGLLIFVLVWGNVLNFGMNFLPLIMYNPTSYAIGPIIIIPIVIGYFVSKLFSPR